MAHVEYDLFNKHFANRAIIPLLPRSLLAPGDTQRRVAATAADSNVMDFTGGSDLGPDVIGPLPDLSNVQGDVYSLFPKTAEDFIFFTISDVVRFKATLKTFKPTSSYDVVNNLKFISEAKDRAPNRARVQPVDIVQTQIAFSRAGLNALGQGLTGDPHFDQFSMLDDFNSKILGDGGPWASVFAKGGLHGVFMVATNNTTSCHNAANAIKTQFQSSIANVAVVSGQARTGANKGHEYFGYRDSISQPALRGLVKPHKGQIQVDAGVIIMGYPGDPILDNPDAPKRPAWTKDGTIMVFRQLEQDAPEFQAYITDNGSKWREFIPDKQVVPPLTDKEGAELFGARIVGRWKSGTPLANAPFRDDPNQATDSEKINNFDYRVRGQTGPSDRFCPFTAHTRKTAPRNLDPYISRRFLESSAIVRAGLPYGPEITSNELSTGKTAPNVKRGLLFVCYQSSLDGGFLLQTIGFAGNDYFPVTSLVPTKHGQDPILGGPPPPPTVVTIKGTAQSDLTPNQEITLLVDEKSGNQIRVDGFTKAPTVTALSEQKFFVTSRGGEYFFVPSISALKVLAGA